MVIFFVKINVHIAIIKEMQRNAKELVEGNYESKLRKRKFWKTHFSYYNTS